MNITLAEHLTVTSGLKMEKQLLARMVQEKKQEVSDLQMALKVESETVDALCVNCERQDKQLQAVALVAMGKGGEVKLEDEHPSLVLVRSLYEDYRKLNEARKPRGKRS